MDGDLLSLSAIIQRGLVRSGRLARLRVAVPDVPGALSEVSALLGQCNASIVEVRHQRAFTSLSLRSAEVEFVLQTLGSEHLREIVERLARAGYQPTLSESDAPAGSESECPAA